MAPFNFKTGTIAAKLALSAGVALLGGCTTLQNQSRVDPRTVANYPRDDLQGTERCPDRLEGDTYGGVINLDCFTFPGEDKPAYEQAAAPNGSGKIMRNRLAAVLIKHSDDVCTQELGRLTANEAISNTLLATLSSGLSGIATIVKGEKAKEIFAGAAGFSTATRSHINAHVFRNVLSTAIARAIHIERDKRRGEIQASLEKDPGAYNVDRMVVDANAYHQLCSFYRGLTLVLEAVDRSKFEESDRAGSLRAAIEFLDRELVTLESRVKTASGVAKTQIETDITNARTKRRELVAELATIRANSSAGSHQTDE